MTGQVYGRLTVVSRIASRSDHPRWECRCICGGVSIVSGDGLRRGSSRSCGCLQRELTAARSKTHGHTGNGQTTAEYQSWTQMRSRCLNPKHHAYANYGGRGISIDPRWSSFETFLEDMGARPSLDHSLDRKDNNQGYGPNNCRWATDKEQRRNCRRSRMVSHDGRTQTLAAWAEETGFSRGVIFERLKRGWDPSRALSIAPRRYVYE